MDVSTDHVDASKQTEYDPHASSRTLNSTQSIKSAVTQLHELTQLELVSEIFSAYAHSQGVLVSNNFLHLYKRLTT